MNQPSQTGKRIVSKGEYMKAQGIRVCYLVLSLCFVFVACTGIGVVKYAVRQTLAEHFTQFYFSGWIGGALLLALILGSIFGGAMLLTTLVKLGVNVFKEARHLEPGVPLTRANTADLPAPDSLVRASAEPVQEQQSMLLRAAAEAQERHEEQLLRAAAGEMQ